MKNIAIVIWLIGFPLMVDFSSYVHQYLLKKPDPSSMGSDTIIFVMYVWIAYLVYEK